MNPTKNDSSIKPERTPTLYRIASVMAMLEVSHATIYRMVERKELELVKISARSSRITAKSLARFLADRAPNA